MKQWDKLWINATVCSCENNYGLIQDAAVAVKEGMICWVGPMQSLADSPESLADDVIDVHHQLLTPGLIDCHTHLVYAGNRAREFEMRLNGMTYEEITRNGGGIQSTVAATRNASEDELFAQSLPRAKALMMSGVTTVEIKSGYGLDWATESKILHVANRIADALPLAVKKTFLGAHIVPAEYKANPDTYVQIVCEEMIPNVANEKLADTIDVFCERIAFNIEQTEKIFIAAKQHSLMIKCHAEQLSDSGSAKLAAKYNALSVDHLEYLNENDVPALATAGTVAVLLPGAFYFLREKKLPPIAVLRKYNVPIAIASDCNPGTSPVLSLTLMLNMACTVFSLTPEEALLGVTCHAAHALGLQNTHGTISVGKVADLAVWNVKQPCELAYYMGNNPLSMLIKAGKIIMEA